MLVRKILASIQNYDDYIVISYRNKTMKIDTNTEIRKLSEEKLFFDKFTSSCGYIFDMASFSLFTCTQLLNEQQFGMINSEK